MPETDARDISPKLGSKSDWRDWYRAVKREADRLGLVQYLTNVVDHGNAAGIPAGAAANDRATQQKWRNLKDSILKSLNKAAESYMKDKDTTAMDAGEVVVDLRDNGRFAANNRQEQRMQKKTLEGLHFHDKDQPADPITFLSQVRDRMNLMPDMYPPEQGAQQGEEQNKALLELLPGMFSKSFKECITRMQEEDNLTFSTICDRLEKTLARLIEEGTYKVENPSFGKAFPVLSAEMYEGNQEVVESSAKKGKKSFKRSRSDSCGSDHEHGTTFVSAQAAKRWKQKLVKTITAKVMAAQGNSKGNLNKGGKGAGKKSFVNKGGGKHQAAPPTCWICNKVGHKAAQCWQNTGKGGNNSYKGLGGKGNSYQHNQWNANNSWNNGGKGAQSQG